MNKKNFDLECNKVLKGIDDQEQKNEVEKDLLLLEKAANGEKIDIDFGFLADKIIKDLFQNGYNNEILIPWGFFDTELGKTILMIKYNIGADVYFVTDLIKFTGKTRQFISKEIKKGNIDFQKRDGIFYFTESQVNKYLSKKGYETIQERREIMYKQMEENIISGDYEREAEYK